MIYLSQGGYLAIGISLIALFVIIFVVSFVLYKKTPVPKGCEDLLANKAKCEGCSKADCPYAKSITKEK